MKNYVYLTQSAACSTPNFDFACQDNKFRSISNQHLIYGFSYEMYVFGKHNIVQNKPEVLWWLTFDTGIWLGLPTSITAMAHRYGLLHACLRAWPVIAVFPLGMMVKEVSELPSNVILAIQFDKEILAHWRFQRPIHHNLPLPQFPTQLMYPYPKKGSTSSLKLSLQQDSQIQSALHWSKSRGPLTTTCRCR